MFLDFHTHRIQNNANIQSILNFIIPEKDDDIEDFSFESFSTSQWISAGIHPWYVSKNYSNIQLDILREVAKNQSVKLIGECGLDRTKGVSLHLQEEVFIKQIRIAEEVRKPLVIHCVRCFSELLSIKKVVRPKIPMVVHGFNTNLEIAKQLLEKDFYFSLGSAILSENSNAQELLKTIPIEKLFLETDDSEVEIEQIYEAASKLKNIDIHTLMDTIKENYFEICLN